jgi:hypothetical protein
MTEKLIAEDLDFPNIMLEQMNTIVDEINKACHGQFAFALLGFDTGTDEIPGSKVNTSSNLNEEQTLLLLKQVIVSMHKEQN